MSHAYPRVKMLLLLLSLLLFLTKTLCISFDCPPCPPITSNFSYTGPYVLPCRRTYADKCGCFRYCMRGKGDPCGGILNYWGTCREGLKCVYRLGGIINQEKHGFCETDFCSIQTCGYKQRCVDRMEGIKSTFLCKCHPSLHDCYQTSTNETNNDNNTSVCADDGRTYTHQCSLPKAQCRSGSFINVKYNGTCNDGDNNHEEIGNYVLHNVTLIYKPNYCLYQKRVYKVGNVISPAYQNPCTVMKCVEGGAVLSITIPGCGEGYQFDLL